MFWWRKNVHNWTDSFDSNIPTPNRFLPVLPGQSGENKVRPVGPGCASWLTWAASQWRLSNRWALKEFKELNLGPQKECVKVIKALGCLIKPVFLGARLASNVRGKNCCIRSVAATRSGLTRSKLEVNWKDWTFFKRNGLETREKTSTFFPFLCPLATTRQKELRAVTVSNRPQNPGSCSQRRCLFSQIRSNWWGKNLVIGDKIRIFQRKQDTELNFESVLRRLWNQNSRLLR